MGLVYVAGYFVSWMLNTQQLRLSQSVEQSTADDHGLTTAADISSTSQNFPFESTFHRLINECQWKFLCVNDRSANFCSVLSDISNRWVIRDIVVSVSVCWRLTMRWFHVECAHLWLEWTHVYSRWTTKALRFYSINWLLLQLIDYDGVLWLAVITHYVLFISRVTTNWKTWKSQEIPEWLG